MCSIWGQSRECVRWWFSLVWSGLCWKKYTGWRICVKREEYWGTKQITVFVRLGQRVCLKQEFLTKLFKTVQGIVVLQHFMYMREHLLISKRLFRLSLLLGKMILRMLWKGMKGRMLESLGLRSSNQFSRVSTIVPLRLRCNIRLNFLLVTLLLYISGIITDISLKQAPFQHYNTKWNSWNRKVKCPRVFGSRQLDSLLKHSCVKLLRGRLEPNPQKFSGTTTQYLLGRDEEIIGDLCIFLAMCTKTYRIIQEERALGMHNLRFVPKFCDISFHGALQNTPGYPCNKSKHVRNNFPS